MSLAMVIPPTTAESVTSSGAEAVTLNRLALEQLVDDDARPVADAVSGGRPEPRRLHGQPVVSHVEEWQVVSTLSLGQAAGSYSCIYVGNGNRNVGNYCPTAVGYCTDQGCGPNILREKKG